MGGSWRRLAVGMLFGVGGLVVLVASWNATQPAVDSRRGRAAALLLTAADPLTIDVVASMDASDALAARLRAQGESDAGPALARRLSEATVSDSEARAFFDANRAVFGGRSLEQSRPSVDRLIRIHKVREDLGIPAPDRGLKGPS